MMSKDRNIVLVVDDDPSMLKCVQRLLRLHAYEPILFSSAEAFKNYPDIEKAACVILDINLNDGSGIELRHGLNDAGISVPVIYMTGNDEPAVRQAALASGCIAFLNKALLDAIAHRAAQESIGCPFIGAVTVRSLPSPSPASRTRLHHSLKRAQSKMRDASIQRGTISQIIPRRMKTPISTRTAVPRVATVRKASLGDRSMARLAVLRSPKAQE